MSNDLKYLLKNILLLVIYIRILLAVILNH